MKYALSSLKLNTTEVIRQFFFTSKELILRPGKSILEYMNGNSDKKYLSPVSYFLVWILFYTLLGHFIFSPFEFKDQLSNLLPVFYFLGLLIVMGFIGHVTIGWPKYNFFESFSVCLFIYGTNYMLAPIVIILEIYFSDLLKGMSQMYRSILTDIPLALFMFYMLMDFVRRADIKYYFIRFILFAVISYAYYYYMMPRVLEMMKTVKAF